MAPAFLLFTVALTLTLYGFICFSLKKQRKRLPRALRKISLVGAFAGAGLGLLLPTEHWSEPVVCALAGVLGAQSLLLFYEYMKAVCATSGNHFYEDGLPPRFYITGDKHRHFDGVANFCRTAKTRRCDVLIILGDAGFNYYGDSRDDRLKEEVAGLNITLFCIHGNKECRPQNVGTYGVRDFCGGRVYYEPAFPNIFFAIDGEIYTFHEKEYLVVGGAHSVDKLRCLKEGLPFFADEMPDDATKAAVEQKLSARGNRIYGMLTHTCPLQYLPTEMFMTTRQKATQKKKRRKKPKKQFVPDIDRATEEWLDTLEQRVDYTEWFCGHYHVDKKIDKIRMMHTEIRPLAVREFNP